MFGLIETEHQLTGRTEIAIIRASCKDDDAYRDHVWQNMRATAQGPRKRWPWKRRGFVFGLAKMLSHTATVTYLPERKTG